MPNSDNKDQINWLRFSTALRLAQLKESSHILVTQLEVLRCFCDFFAWKDAEQIILLVQEALHSDVALTAKRTKSSSGP